MTRSNLGIAAALLFAGGTAAFGAVGTWGIWGDREEKHFYAFLANNEFRFSGTKIVGFSSVPGEKPRVEVTREEREGVWETGSGLCWLGDKKRQTGNTMIYVDTVQCCMSVQILENRLLLSEIWKKGDYDELGICSNRVLTKRTKFPDKAEAIR